MVHQYHCHGLILILILLIIIIKVTTEAALGLIGGTMGLFTGFSILSAVEIIYHLLKAFLSLLILRFRNTRN